MNLSSSDLYEILQSKGIQQLYHANSVITSCQYIRNDRFMSRGCVERRNLTQTSQRSDGLDKQYRIWNHVFMDTVDIHDRSGNVNYYGPVLFVISADLIREMRRSTFSITKVNPTKWDGKTRRDRWFTSMKEIEENFSEGQFAQMIVAKNVRGEVPFREFVEKIILDDPGRKTWRDVEYYSMAVGALRYAMDESRLDIPIERRKCSQGCACGRHWNYYTMHKMFDAKQYGRRA